MYQPKVSFITATYNSEKTLEQTISSILDQSYKNIEYVIIDGGSKDATLNIIKKYENHIRWISEKDNGICDAIGKGTLMATGDYINVIGSDDCLSSPRILEQVVDELQDSPDLLSCNRYSVYEKTKLQYLDKHRKIYADDEYPFIPFEGAYISRSLFKKYPYDRRYAIASDAKFYLQCLCDPTVKIKYSELVTAFFSLSGSSSLSHHNEVAKELLRIYNELGLKPSRQCFPVSDSVKAKFKKALKRKLPGIRNLYLRLFKPWSYHPLMPHTCENKICRWCGRP